MILKQLFKTIALSRFLVPPTLNEKYFFDFNCDSLTDFKPAK